MATRKKNKALYEVKVTMIDGETYVYNFDNDDAMSAFVTAVRRHDKVTEVKYDFHGYKLYSTATDALDAVAFITSFVKRKVA